VSTLVSQAHVVDGFALIPLRNCFEILVRGSRLKKRGSVAERGYLLPRRVKIYAFERRERYEPLPKMRPEVTYHDDLHAWVEELDRRARDRASRTNR
jgi:hypothetical protein